MRLGRVSKWFLGPYTFLNAQSFAKKKERKQSLKQPNKHFLNSLHVGDLTI